MLGERPHFALRLAFGACLTPLLLCASTAPTLANNAAARDVLTKQHGLLERQGRWVLPLELELRRDFASLSGLRKELQHTKIESDASLTTMLQQNARIEVRIAEISARLRAPPATNNLGALQRRLLNERLIRDRADLEALQRAWIDPMRLAGHDVLKRQAVRLTNQRNALATTILKIHEQRVVLIDRYATLAQDRQVRTALENLGGAQQLGPLTDYQAKLAEYERDVFTRELPLYRDNDDLRVSGLIGRTPVTFSWRESSEPTMLTASVIEATGLEVPEDAAKVQVRLPDGREITVREFEVPYMRFGNQLLRSVKAYALPPEAENAGTQIGASAFEGLAPKAEPQRLRLVLN